MKILILIILVVQFPYCLNANENTCKKFDFKCKSKKFIEDTKNFQKKEWAGSKKQIQNTKDKIIKAIPKKK
jgi:hypothetical protein